ncbi:HD domain-containing protein [uncultured Tenacibaculum sp.]|uniref:HD domain-containing protein n=1 Tax=uncultured Tenacibaculum sp. TaxID=174713 RepID=UPI0026293D2B|nr:HD domain-containing protein [uncultured Tenacibaculum sp.]
MRDILIKLENEIKPLFKEDTTGHDLHHLKRVMNVALTIQEKEGGDKLVITISALLHDLHRIMQSKSGSFYTPKESLPLISEILNKVDITDFQKRRILHCIEYHEEYSFSENGKTVNDIETLILQDADNLDAIGAIGVARTFLFGGYYKVKMWTPEYPFDRKIYDEDKKDPSVIHHFHSKLIKLKDNINTKTARKMANKRHDFMMLYLNEFFDEWKGTK